MKDPCIVSASALGRLGETAFGNPSRDFTLRKAGYSYPSRWVEEPGYWLYEGVFGGPSSDKDHRNTTLEGAEGGERFGKKVERGAGCEKTLVVAKPKSRGNPYFLHIGGVVDLQGDRGSWKGSCSPVYHLRSERRGAVSGETGFLGVW
ncbi:hypothetical protein DFH06DRAFT_1136481 [Mycena polygramma]|nr:hypothetical protein DFH06DRAFT_1136481 [Mycena polygramma]